MVLCIQANPSRPRAQLPLLQLQPQLSKSYSGQTSCKVSRPTAKPSAYISCAPVLQFQHYSLPAKYPRRSTVCLLGGNDNPEGEKEASPLKSLGNVFGSMKGKSLEDVLKEQMKNQDFDDGGSGGGSGGGGNPPGGGGGGGDVPEDEDLPDETLQIVLASAGFIFVYSYILDGEDMMRILKDFFKFLYTGKKSIRLGKKFDQLGRLWERIRRQWTKKKVVGDKFWLERSIMNTTTWFDSPDKYRRGDLASIGKKVDDGRRSRKKSVEDDFLEDDYYY